ncbi:MAG: hypothetical protein LBD40_00920, partial [Puniceicoccales bacterium]|nr:hypothetical protein [Puniceicoccales bacterium]
MKREGKLEKKGFWRMALLIAALYGTVIPAGAVILDEELLPRLQAINAAANDTDRAPLLQTLVHDLGGQLNEPTVKQLLAVANGNGLTEV